MQTFRKKKCMISKKKYLKDKLVEFYSQLKCDCDAYIGWNYSEVYEKKFIEQIKLKFQTEKKKIPKQREIKSKLSSKKVLQEVEDILKEKNVKDSWEKLKTFINFHNKNSLFDTTNHTTIKSLSNFDRKTNEINKLNILTYGSGICGLFFAHTLKQILGELVEITIYDKRIVSRGKLKPFSREWLTALKLPFFKTTNLKVYSLIKKFSLSDNVGLPLNYIEMILFLFCKLQNINFIFDSEEVMKPLLNSNYDLIVDATGGRFKYEYNSNQTSEFIPHEISSFINNIGQRDKLYEKKNVLFKQVGRYFYPLIDKTPIKIAQFKITNLDNEDYINLGKFIGYENKFEGMFYLWKGLLPSEINQSILFVNINNKIYDRLTELINEKTLLKKFILNDYEKIFCNKINTIINILKKSDNFERILIESPFIYHPKIINYKQIVLTENKTPIIPIGDSVFNGNVKSSNGLYKHLPMINDLNKEISKSYINILTKYLEKDIKEKNNQCFNHIHNQLHDVLMKVWS